MQAELIYYGGIFCAAILALIAQKVGMKEGKKVNYIFWTLSMIVLMLIFGFRECGVGVDDNSYKRIFEEVSHYGVLGQFFRTTMEPGYLTLNYIVSLFTDNFQVMLFITAAIPIFLYYKALEYESDKISMFWGVFLTGTLLFIYFCGITRLFIASSIIAYGFRFVLEKKPIKYIIIVLIATSFHYSAIFMMFLLYFAIEKEDAKKSNLKLIILITIVMPLIIYIVTTHIFPNMGDRYQGYTDGSSTTFTLMSLDKLPFVIIALFFTKDMEKTNPNIKKYITVYAMAVIISVYSVFMDIGRMQWYCVFAMCIILPNILEVLKKIKKQEFALMYIPLMIMYALLYSHNIMMGATRKCMLIYNNILL